MIFVWNLLCKDTDVSYQGDIQKVSSSKQISHDNTLTANSWRIFVQPMMLCVMMVIVLQGMLRDGVTTWMPSFISETYQMSHLIGILTCVILPIFSIFCYQSASRLYRNKFKNPVLCSAFFFAVGCLSAFSLILLNGKTAALSVFCSAVLTGSMHGVNLLLICMIPPFFKNTGKVSTVSGVLNSCTYVGSAISTYGIALITEHFGWNATLLSWLIIAFLGTILNLLAAYLWKCRK